MCDGVLWDLLLCGTCGINPNGFSSSRRSWDRHHPSSRLYLDCFCVFIKIREKFQFDLLIMASGEASWMWRQRALWLDRGYFTSFFSTLSHIVAHISYKVYGWDLSLNWKWHPHQEPPLRVRSWSCPGSAQTGTLNGAPPHSDRADDFPTEPQCLWAWRLCANMAAPPL